MSSDADIFAYCMPTDVAFFVLTYAATSISDPCSNVVEGYTGIALEPW